MFGTFFSPWLAARAADKVGHLRIGCKAARLRSQGDTSRSSVGYFKDISRLSFFGYLNSISRVFMKYLWGSPISKDVPYVKSALKVFKVLTIGESSSSAVVGTSSSSPTVGQVAGEQLQVASRMAWWI